jgi:hypothetical protein
LPAYSVLLNADYSIDFKFNLYLHLLRGRGLEASEGFLINGSSLNGESLRSFEARAWAAYRQMRRDQGILQEGIPNQISFEEAVTYAAIAPIAVLDEPLALHSTYVLYNAWLAEWKFSECDYKSPSLSTIDASFCVDDFGLEKQNIAIYG